MSSDGEMLQCYNRSCGQLFDAEQNTSESCMHHPGFPVFHDANKKWSCCEKKTTDFTEFLNIKGCTKSYHSNIKPQEPPKSQNKIELEEPIRPPLQQKETFLRPDENQPLICMPSTVGASLKPLLEKMQKKTTLDNNVVAEKKHHKSESSPFEDEQKHLKRNTCNYFQKYGICTVPFCAGLHISSNTGTIILLKHLLTEENVESYESLYGKATADLLMEILTYMHEYGRILSFRILQNESCHLVRNIYVEYETEINAITALQNFNPLCIWKFTQPSKVQVLRLSMRSSKDRMCGNPSVCAPGVSSCLFLHFGNLPLPVYKKLKDFEE